MGLQIAGTHATQEVDLSELQTYSLDVLEKAAINRHGYTLCLAVQDESELSLEIANDLGRVITELVRRLREHENVTPEKV